jgi:glycosyltransferase involved in cell wall biosynthesis
LQNQPKLLIVSAVLPFPRKSGQQQRVYYTLKALQNAFHITFLTVAPESRRSEILAGLAGLCHDVILVPSLYSGGLTRKFFLKVSGEIYALGAGVKFSNFLIGKIELTPRRVARAVKGRQFDCVLFEYWHVSDCVAIFRDKGIPCILDMHDILWQSYKMHLEASGNYPPFYKRYALSKYKTYETDAWRRYQLIVAITPSERDEVRKVLPHTAKVSYVGMGTDLSAWPYCWEPREPVRVGYYGGLGNPVRQREALRCYERIMPQIWRRMPEAELWMIGSDPPAFIRDLQEDPRVKVTGYVERVQEALHSMSLILCPFVGTFGFRSRLIEAMALGVPVVATRDAGHGMALENERGIFLLNSDAEMAKACLNLLDDQQFALKQSRLARKQVEEKFSFEATYGKLPGLFLECLKDHEPGGGVSQRMLG